MRNRADGLLVSQVLEACSSPRSRQRTRAVEIPSLLNVRPAWCLQATELTLALKDAVGSAFGIEAVDTVTLGGLTVKNVGFGS